MTTLDELRAELAAIDRDLLAAVARRQALAQQIGRIKQAAGTPVRDFRQERDVIERARTAAAGLGLTPALGEELMLTLIRASLTAQERDRVLSVLSVPPPAGSVTERLPGVGETVAVTLRGPFIVSEHGVPLQSPVMACRSSIARVSDAVTVSATPAS